MSDTQARDAFVDKLMSLTREAIQADSEEQKARRRSRLAREEICRLIGGDNLAAIHNAQVKIGKLMTGTVTPNHGDVGVPSEGEVS